ncbi:MAG: DUF3987 domain-containing protein [Planctomycetota bacterium]|nr:MAG: DUF3987 domain-containing protein [Planctomycetota bacterium]
MRPVELLLEQLPDAKPVANGWSACCPTHDDTKPSLSIKEGDDGRALVHCHAGCEPKAICEALGLSLADLMPNADNGVNVNGNGQTAKKTPIPLTSKPAGKTFATPDAAIKELEKRHGPMSKLWTYHNAKNEPVGVVVRWELPDGGKEIRPVRLHGEGWQIGGMPEPRPLYGLPDLAGANRVYVCEGEKAADALRSIGLTATTSAHGAQSADKTDWEPLEGKEVIVLPDNDPAGRKYADTVAGILGKLTAAPVVKVVGLPDLPDRGDAADFVAAREGTDAAELRQIVEALANEAEPFNSLPPAVPERFEPFPVHALPEPFRSFVSDGAKAIGCDPSYVALPTLTTIAAAIGNTRRIQLKRGWTVPAILWTAIVGESGTAKTPAFKLAMRPIRERQRKALARYEEEAHQYEIDLAHYEKKLAEWKRDKKTAEDPPEKPDAPQAERCIVSDTTVEALAPILLANPRGLLLARDELAGWIGSFDRYAGGKGGADAAHWLSMHNGESIIVDRKTGHPRTIFVPQAAVCVCGGIQPAILHRALGTEHRESGLAARLLVACPPRKAKRWTEADIDPKAETEIKRLIERLCDLQPTTGDDGEPRPVVIGLTPEAKAAWKAYYNNHAQEQVDLAGDLSAAWSKLEEYAARLALVVHVARWAADDPTLASADVVDEVSMEAGIVLATWFKGEARRVYALLGESEEDREQRRLVEWLERKGGSATPRDVRMGCRWLREPGEAEAALEQLVRDGWGHWEQTPSGRRGQPTRRFRLSTPSAVNGNRALAGENSNTVDVDTVDATESQAESEWEYV